MPPSARRLRVDRPARVGPGRALLGAGIAVAGVLLGIVAVLALNPGEDSARPAALTRVSSAPTSAGQPTAGAAGTPGRPPTVRKPTVAPSLPVAAPAVVAPAVVAPAVPAVTVPVVTVVPVTVLNNSRLSGLAKRAAARYRAGGWPVPVTGNFTGRLRVTTVYFAPGQQAAAARFARQFGVARVLPRFPGLPGRGLTVVLTRDAA